MKKSVLIFICIWALLYINAQKSIDLVTISGHLSIPQPYKESLEGKAQEFRGMINLKSPVVFSEASIWANDITYLYSHVDNDPQFHDSIADPIDLYGFIFQTGLIQKINEKSNIWIIITPRFMSDFRGTKCKGCQLGGTLLYERFLRDGLSMRFGSMYNQEFSGPLLVPLIGINWDRSEKWNICGLLPISSKIKYNVNKNLSFAIGHYGLITSYRLGGDEYVDNYIEKTSIDISFTIRQRIKGNFFIEGQTGYSLSRDYTQYEKDDKVDFKLSIISFGDDRIQKNYSFKDGPFFRLKLIYNLPID